ncbi:MAG: DUF3604 domain-containing protein [Pseudomonadales bacterium]
MNQTRSLGIFGLCAVTAILVACGGSEIPAEEFVTFEQGNGGVAAKREPCAENNPLKNAYFGDLHVHTSLSNDGYSFGSRTRPDDAYRYAFAKGSATLPVERGNEQLKREVQIDRPLDFMGVTDHAEFLGEQTLCGRVGSDIAKSEFCAAFEEGEGRNPSLLKKIFSPFPSRDEELCGADGKRCTEASKIPWKETIASAEIWNDISSECERTAFIAFEYSSVRLGSNLHRNVIFKNSVVPARPVSYLDAPREWRLWEILEEQCLAKGEGCDVLAIPHNSNISNGRMFAVDYAGAPTDAEQAERASLRMKLEPIVEVMQHKGDSECRNGLSGVLGGEDELCDFEKFENLAFSAVAGTDTPDDCYTGPFSDYVPHKGPNCLSRNSYVRYALIEGLKEQERIGVNPFKFGLSASTDTHNGTGGAVSEQSYQGHLGWGDGTAARRVAYQAKVPGNTSNNPGGLIGIWSEENSRSALFESMQNKEVFGTSGPRIQPRFFAGWDLSTELCADPDMIKAAYSSAVPMGGDLMKSTNSKSPTFLASAMADFGTAAEPGVSLQRLQIIKGWYDDEGNHHQRIHDVAGDANNGASVNLDNCKPQGRGHEQLCAVWSDPDFDEGQSAVYYMRAVENPTCRYSARQCLTIATTDRPEDCSNDSVPQTIQERAWTSPIWYSAE